MLRPGDVRNALAAKAEQMLNAEHGTPFVVGKQAKGVGMIRLREDIDHWQIVDTEIDGRPPVRTPRRDHKTVNLLPEQLVEMLTFARGVVGRVAHEDCDPMVRELPFESFEN